MNDTDVRDLLARVADEVPATPLDPEPLLRRGYGRMARTAVAVALAAAAIAVATVAGFDAIRSAPIPADRPTPSPGILRSNGEVLNFTDPSGARGDLVAVNPETGEERVLVEDLDRVYSARWSADGRWVAYETRTPEGEGIELWVVGASQEPRQVVAGPSTWIWSSTGAELAAIRLRSPDSNIAGSTLTTIDPATGETTDVGTIPERVGDVKSGPTWSPDGTRFVFGTRDGAIYSIDVRSGASSLLMRLPAEHLDSVDQIVWSPDGVHIAAMSDGNPGGVYVMDADGSNVRVLQDEHSIPGVAWSPDGTRLAYQDDDCCGAIWAAPTDGSAPTEIGSPLPSSCYLLCPSDLIWSPDGSQIAFRSIWIRGGGDVSVDVSAFDADGQGEAERIDELTYQSWDGGSYHGEYTWF